MQAQIRSAARKDLQRLKRFLVSAGLSIDGLSEETIEYFLMMEDEDGNLYGTLGIEKFAKNGLLRSLVITSGKVEEDLLLLFQQAFQYAREKQITRLFLATNKRNAIPFFQVMGFRMIDQRELPKELAGSPHIQSILTVDNSVFLKFSF